MHILVVDDDRDLRTLLAYIFERRGHRVSTAGDGEAALSSFAQAPADLVVLDVSMPHLDGIETCRRLRAASGVPVIMLTVRNEEEDIVRSLETGADDHITKPFNQQELVARVERLLRRAYGRPTPAAAP